MEICTDGIGGDGSFRYIQAAVDQLVFLSRSPD